MQIFLAFAEARQGDYGEFQTFSRVEGEDFDAALNEAEIVACHESSFDLVAAQSCRQFSPGLFSGAEDGAGAKAEFAFARGGSEKAGQKLRFILVV